MMKSMDMGGHRPCRQRVEIGSFDIEGKVRCRRRRRDVIKRDTSCLSTDIISGVCFSARKGFKEIVGSHNKRTLVAIFLALEATSLLLDVCGTTQKRFRLAALILSTVGCFMTIFSCLIQKSDTVATPDAERQLGVVEFSFSLVQLIATFLAAFGVKIITNYNASVLLLVFAIIAVVFIFKKNEKSSDMSMSSCLANNIPSLVNLELSEMDGLSDWEPITGFLELCLPRSFRESIALYARIIALDLRFSEMKLDPEGLSVLAVIQKVEGLHHVKIKSSSFPGYVVPVSFDGHASACRHVPSIYRLEWDGTYAKIRFICYDDFDQAATYREKSSDKLLKGCDTQYNKHCMLLFNFDHRFKNIRKELSTADSQLARILKVRAPVIVDGFRANNMD